VVTVTVKAAAASWAAALTVVAAVAPARLAAAAAAGEVSAGTWAAIEEEAHSSLRSHGQHRSKPAGSIRCRSSRGSRTPCC